MLKAYQIINGYYVLVIALYPLWVGTHNYSDISHSKAEFLLLGTLIFAALWIGTYSKRKAENRDTNRNLDLQEPKRIRIKHLAVISVIMATWSMLLTAILSRNTFQTLLSERGPLLHICYWGVMLLCARFGSWSHWIVNGAAICSVINAVISTLQVLDINVGELYPEGLSYYDAHQLYSGEYLGTLGNVDILGVVMTVYAVLMAGYLVKSTGGTERDMKTCWVAAIGLTGATYCGSLAGTEGFILTTILSFAFIIPVLLVRSKAEIWRWIASLCMAAAGWGLSHSFQMARGLDQNAFLIFLLAGMAALTAGILCIRQESMLEPKHYHPYRYSLPIILIGTTLTILTGILVLYFIPLSESSGTLFEIQELMHFRAQEHFGSYRIKIWSESLSVFKQNWGWGIGEPYSEFVSITFERATELGNILTTQVDNAHNILISWLLHYGIIGTTFITILTGSILLAGITGSPVSKICSVGMLAYIVIECTCQGGYFSDPIFWILGSIILSEYLTNAKITSETDT